MPEMVTDVREAGQEGVDSALKGGVLGQACLVRAPISSKARTHLHFLRTQESEPH